MSSRGDLAVAIGFVILGILILVFAAQIPEGSVQDPLGTAGLPMFTGLVIIVLGSVIAGRRFLQIRTTDEKTVVAEGAVDEPDLPTNPWRPVVIWGASLVYLYLLKQVGWYLVFTPILLGFLLWLMGIRRLFLLVGIPVGFSIVALALFDLFLKVDLP